jgi:phenylacetate-CoA ligase
MSARDIVKPVYYRLPGALRFGQGFLPALEMLRESECWDAMRLQEFQMSRLREILKHSVTHVPYYRRIFRKVGFDPDQVRSISDLEVVPLLDKDIIRENLTDLLAENVSRARMVYYTTGGTTGQPLGIYGLKGAGGRQKAFIYKLWERVGFQFRQTRAMLRGWVVKNPAHWNYDPSERAYVFSNFHLTADNVARYYFALRPTEFQAVVWRTRSELRHV